MCSGGEVSYTGGFGGLMGGVTSAFSGAMAAGAQEEAYYANIRAQQQNEANRVAVAKAQLDQAYANKVREALLNIENIQVAQNAAVTAAAVERSKVAIEMLKAREAAAALAGSAGIQGNTVDMQQKDIYQAEGRAQGVIRMDLEAALFEGQLRKRSAKAGARVDDFMYVPSVYAPYSGPTAGSAIFGGLGNILSGLTITPGASCTPPAYSTCG